MITFRNPLWDTFIEFIDKLRLYPSFETMDNGRYKNRLDMIWNRATDRMRLDKSDLDLISKTFIFLSEKNIDNDLIEYMNECSVLGYKCRTSAEGEKIIREAEAEVKQRKHDKLIRDLKDEKQREFEEAKAKYDEYMASQNNIIDNYEKKKSELEDFENKVKELDEQKEPEEKKQPVLTNEEKVKETKKEVLQNEDSTPDVEDGEEAEVIK
jgi:hypothetical protein